MVLEEGPTKGLEDKAITAEGKFSINFARSKRTFDLSLHYNSFFYVEVFVSYNIIDIKNIFNIHKYVIKNTI